MNQQEDSTSRPGSGADLSRRMERIEARQDEQAREQADLKSAVARVEQSIVHQNQLYERDFKSLNESVGRMGSVLDKFMARMEGLIDGSIETTQTRQGRELVEDYQDWRREVDADRTRIHFLGRVVTFLLTTNVLALAAGLYALLGH